MSACPNCDLPVTAAPWRYDAHEHGVHWVCPTDERIELDEVYAPITLSEAIADFLKGHPYRPEVAKRIPA